MAAAAEMTGIPGCEYGLGRVAALSGNGVLRKATVDFASPARRLQFVIAHSPFRPLPRSEPR